MQTQILPPSRNPPDHEGPEEADRPPQRHSRACASARGKRCNCKPTIEAWAYDRRSGRKIRRSFTGPGARGGEALARRRDRGRSSRRASATNPADAA